MEISLNNTLELSHRIAWNAKTKQTLLVDFHARASCRTGRRRVDRKGKKFKEPCLGPGALALDLNLNLNLVPWP